MGTAFWTVFGLMLLHTNHAHPHRSHSRRGAMVVREHRGFSFALCLRGGRSDAASTGHGSVAADPLAARTSGDGCEVDKESALKSLKLMAERLHMVRARQQLFLLSESSPWCHCN